MSEDERLSSASPTSTIHDDSTFRSPNISSRGRKRKPVFHDDGSEVSYLSSVSSPKRGRPRVPPPARGGRVVRGGRAAPGGDKRLASIGEDSLFNLVKAGKNYDQALNRWIEDYDNLSDNAITKLQQLIIHSCGCRGVLTTVLLNSVDYPEIIRRMSDEFEDDTAEYPIVQSGAAWRKFRANYENFLKLLIHKCRSGIIFDNKLMDSVIQMLTGLADSQIRAFRHTATFAAMKISTALVDLVVQLVKLKEQTTRQIETEKQKLKQRNSNEQLEVLLMTKQELEEKIGEIGDMTSFLFKSVFVHRYRDVVPDIRCICITELGNWMRQYPQFFLEDSYLKYVGWMLYDKVADVRLKCMNALLPLFEENEHVSKLELFLTKFKERLVSLVMDSDTEVAIKTCQLLTAVFEHFPNLLNPADCVPIYEAVYSSNRVLAVAAGEFLNSKVFQGTDENDEHRNKMLISDLILFFVEGEVHTHATYLVDALIDTSPVVKDWATMVEMLLSDECDEYENQLVEILTCAVRQASTGDPPCGRTGKKSAKDTRQIHEDRTQISEVMIPALPKLLGRHIADRDKVVNFTSIPQYFVLELYPSGRMMKYLDELVTIFERIVEQYSDDEILHNIAVAFSYFKSNLAVQQHTEAPRSQLLDNLAIQLRISLEQFADEGRVDEEDEAVILSQFRKVNAFAATEDLRRTDLWDPTQHLINNAKLLSNPHICEQAILYLFLTISWDVRRLVCESEANVNDAVKKLKKRRDQFLNCVKGVIATGATGVENAFLCLCDLLVLLNWKLSADLSAAKDLEINLNKDLTNKLTTFVLDNVFVNEENDTLAQMDQHAQIELMAKRRNLLAQFCKLIMHGVLPIKDAALVLKYYVKFYTDFGDILKTLLVKCRELDRIATARAVSRALIDAFEDLRTTSPGGVVNPVDESFIAIRDLAKRFAVSFGSDAVKNRDAMATIHKFGILHAIQNTAQNARGRGRTVNKSTAVAYLEVLMEFSPRLIRQDKAAVLRYLERHCPATPEQIASDDVWQPYLLYRNSLQEKGLQPSAPSVAAGNKRRRVDLTPTPSEVGTISVAGD